MESHGSLTGRLTRATAHLTGPVAVVDLDRFDANAAELLGRAGGLPVRLATKSVRVRSLVDRALAAGFSGLMTTSLAEALWHAGHGARDALVGYPSVDVAALAELAADPRARAAVTLMVDDVAQLALVERALDDAGADPAGPPVQVCLDVDASLRLRLGPLTLHVGTRRSPLHAPDDVARLAARVATTPGLHLRGLMTYEAQIAGLPDDSVAVRAMKRVSARELLGRRDAVLTAVRDAVGRDVALVNAGGTGSLERSAADPSVTEVTAGSGLFVPATFDGYRAFRPRPAAFFGLDVVRVPGPGWATAYAGGYPASGPAGPSRLPRVVTPGWSLTRREGAGEVQTPLRGRHDAAPLAVGDRVWFRHAKAGELMERFAAVHLVRGDQVTDVVPTYRGEAHTFA
ncbi:alanine racemase domain protein [Xylanimonas cellulosilytica DSM 15894]|uniref:Alanine racemase domain protein n=1 Tax=Xylanimonas cellulosilytica (strain DSM 15894 / JCM 12276 / CECT 5975 / KCTC 9989 / LMG 20990 / NBRC 107835 / XIL07) TaxID=446471 RepID=D1BZ63_XYLCX|nr:alanine racemase [Xylanimonas cellulosilytica]ACZ31960.1 alanine racemase domain protein [Xylanimonas cellulosilytica DSM 15894]